MKSSEEGYFWPTREQELLLKATLLKGEQAIAAWKNWAAAINFDQLDAGSQRLLPLLYRNLIDNNVQHPAINIYKGFYRMTWYKNRLLQHRITNVLCLLDSHGIPALLLKGVALASVYYKDWALRPMNDFDLLVPQNDALEAVDLLCRSGWKPAASMPDESDLLIRHASHLINDSGVEFDLHWRIMPESGCTEADNKFIGSAMEIDFNGVSVSVLSHTDQLFHVLVHGARWNYVAPLRWAPDSMMILREAGLIIDWHRLLNEARHRCLVMPLKKTLIYLHEVFAAPIPAEIISNLKRMRPSLTERMEFYMHGNSRSVLRDIFFLWFMHVRTCDVSGPVRLMFQFPSFLGKFWKVPADKNLGVFLICKLVKKIGNNIRDSSGFNRAA
jgi:hypothetical protein